MESLSWKIFSVEGNEKLLQTADAGKDMGRLLAKGKGCEEIDLSKTGLSKEGIVALAEALKDTPTLPWTGLKLHGNLGLLKSADVGKAVGQLMGKAQAFDFSLHNVTEDFLLGLAEALEDKAALAWKSFKVRGNEGLLSTTKAAGAVGALLAKSTACKEICLGSTGLGKEGLVAMAEALEDKAALAWKSFDVGFNEGPLSTAKAAGAVGALLAKSTACEEIRLNSTGLGKEGLVALAEALKDTPSLPWKKVFG